MFGFFLISEPLSVVVIYPLTVRMDTKLTIIVTAIASHFFPDEMGYFWRFRSVFELDFSDGQALVVAMKFIDLEGVLTILDKPSRLIDQTGFAEVHQLTGISQWYLLSGF